MSKGVNIYIYSVSFVFSKDVEFFERLVYSIFVLLGKYLDEWVFFFFWDDLVRIIQKRLFRYFFCLLGVFSNYIEKQYEINIV